MVCLDRQRDSPLGDILVITILSGDSSMTYKQRMLPVVRKVSCYAAPYGSCISQKPYTNIFLLFTLGNRLGRC